MDFKANISIQTAVELLYSRKMSLSNTWSYEQTNFLLYEIEKINPEKLVQQIDYIENNNIDVAAIPQFGNIDTIINVCKIVNSIGNQKLSYKQLGFLLTENLNAKENALLKYGETHGKGAALMGLVILEDSYIKQSALTTGFAKIEDMQRQRKIATLLYLRIPIIQVLITEAQDKKIQGLNFMPEMSDSTKLRRSICIKHIFKDLKELDNKELNRRIDNIEWGK